MLFRSLVPVIVKEFGPAVVLMQTFPNPVNALVVTEGVPMYEEHRRRQSVKVSGSACNVFVNPDESVQVTDNIASELYQSMLEAPEYIQQQVAMLRLVEENTYIPEVGMKLSENTYWIYVANNKN